MFKMVKIYNTTEWKRRFQDIVQHFAGSRVSVIILEYAQNYAQKKPTLTI